MNQNVMQESPIVKVQHVAGEGMVLIGGRPDMERLDMPCISFESIDALKKCDK